MEHKLFIRKLFIKNNSFRKGRMKVVGQYKNSKSKLLVEDKYGKCKILAADLMRGSSTNIANAVDKTSYFKKRAFEVHGDLYGYELVDYINARTKIKIDCKVHGYYEQLPYAHLQGKGCHQCSKENPTHFSLNNWVKLSKKSNNFNKFTFYVLECWNKKEKFYKIGRTFTTLKKRYSDKSKLPYDYSILHISHGTAKEIFEKEIKIKLINKHNRYYPSLRFNGHNECYKKVKFG